MTQQDLHTTPSPSRNDRAVGSRHADVVVVGAGLAGLAAATVAARSGARVLLLDTRSPGGRAGTHITADGIAFNNGPRALYRQGAGLRVLRDLGIEPEAGVAPRHGHALSGGQVHRLPVNGPSLLASGLLGARSKLRAGALLARLPRLDAAAYDHTTLEDFFVERRLDRAARSLLRGVVRTATYVDDIEHLSAGSALRQVQMAVGGGVLYLHRGWQQLVDTLTERAGQLGVESCRSAVRAVEPVQEASARGSGWVVRTAEGDITASAVVVATGTPDAAAALLPVPLDLTGLGPPATAACLDLAVRRRPPRGFLLGLDEPTYLSVHTSVADLAPPGVHVVHVMRYGARDRELDRSELWGVARAAGIRSDDVVHERFLRRMVVTGGIPVASAGGAAGRPGIEVPGAGGLFVAGDWVGPEGMLGDAALSSGASAGAAAASAASAATMATVARRPSPVRAVLPR